MNALNGDPNPPNGDLKPELIVNGDVNDADNGLVAYASSPTTPVDHTLDIKMSMDIQEPESDVRHEPIPIRVDKLDHASVVPEVGTPLDPASIAIAAPSGTPPPATGELLDDVKMAEDATPPATAASDVSMETALAAPNGSNKRSREPTPVASDPASAPPPTPSAHEGSVHEDDGSIPPPAKRPRTFSENDMMSATPPPVSGNSTHHTDTTATNGATPVPAGPSILSIAQFRFCQSTIRNLKKSKDAGPFLRPVDAVALNIPHYITIIKTPMDFSTVERKLASSNPSKPDTNRNNPRYTNAEDFVTDVRLIFNNCLTFNGPDHPVAAMGKRVEDIFDKQIKNMPAAAEPVARKATPPPPPPPAPVPEPKRAPPVRRPSTSVPVIRRSEAEAATARPKREIHPPPPKDLPYADAPKKARKGKSHRDDGSAEQLKFCYKVLSDLNRKAHWAIANPFYEPVDHVALNLPTYPKVVKKPMDLSTMRKKLDANVYSNGFGFWEDFKLMIRNCFAFNPTGTPVNQAGAELQRLFDEKWKGLPQLRDPESEDDDDDGEDDSEDGRLRTAGFFPAAWNYDQMDAIARMERQIETMRAEMEGKAKTPVAAPKPKKIKKEKPAPVASSSKPAPKPPKTSGPVHGGGNKRKGGKKAAGDDDALSFEQKKDLSEAIQTLDGPKLEKVITIIHEGVPEIRDSTEEIELEIDLLPAAVLTKLYNFVLRPLRAPATKRSRTGKGTGTGGLKRKSMDEDVEAEKIRQLEERMRLFEGNNGNSASAPAGKAHSDASSDSSDASDSSGSDSELTTMLKRQRPASPSPSSDMPILAADIMDISDPAHGAKRRRIFAPVMDGAQRGWAVSVPPTLDAQYDSEEEYLEEDAHSLDTERLHAQGEVGTMYKSTNNMLHDLHALRQQRMLSGPSMPGSDRHGQLYPSSSPYHQEHAKSMLPPMSERPRLPWSAPSEGAGKAVDGGMDAVELEVKHRYEETNRASNGTALSRCQRPVRTALRTARPSAARLAVTPSYRLIISRSESSTAGADAQTPKEALKAARRLQDKLQHNWDQPILTYEQVKPKSTSPSPDAYLIDVREPDEVIQGSIPSSVNLPLSVISNSLHLPREAFKAQHGFEKPKTTQELVFYCRSGKRSATACDIAKRNGYTNVLNYEGSWLDWVQREGAK
ncbi:hypothetical protein FIBSPDRAFT_882662 [Athelia psychrophila]|uniref:Bromodomain-containing protein n=1 Tax=Athelia psychrophila TaxID=1759441 RepID=A0A166V3C6_9AGAM|nr:hypothetical protein FIBSPDRAFT_882662 [Fibularhizoctonia sp. CBS 109695]